MNSLDAAKRSHFRSGAGGGALPAKNGWTGGQYSLFRAIFGLYLFSHYFRLALGSMGIFSCAGLVVLSPHRSPALFYTFPNIWRWLDSPAVVHVSLWVAAGLSLLFVIGWFDRCAAFGLWYVSACFFSPVPAVVGFGWLYIGWLLLAHVGLPPAPYGSWAARGRPDPGGDWRMPAGIFAVAWILMALGYAYGGYKKLFDPAWMDGTALKHVLENPLARPGFFRDFLLALPVPLLKFATWIALAAELGFAPLALFARLRPWLWLLLLLMHLGLMLLIQFAELSLGMVMLHLFTFDPAWIRPRRVVSKLHPPGERVGMRVSASEKPLIPTFSPKGRGGEEAIALVVAPPPLMFYDGHCGLCHAAVRFLLAEDTGEPPLRMAPLESAAFRDRVSLEQRARLPDSVIVLTPAGELLARSRAALFLLAYLGGIWRLIGGLLWFVPVALRDWVYGFVARIRRHLFAAPPEACPLVPPHLRERFLS